MARIIKGTEKPTPPLKKSPIMKGNLFREQQEIETLYAEAQIDIKSIVSKAKQQATLAKERAMTEGVTQAFAEASQQALDLFIERAKYCLALKDQLRQLTSEISQKILGSQLALPESEQDKILQTAIQKIRSRHKLKIQAIDIRSFDKISHLPEFELEAVTDLPAGFLRIVTEIGSTLWDEKMATEQIISKTEKLI